MKAECCVIQTLKNGLRCKNSVKRLNQKWNYILSNKQAYTLPTAESIPVLWEFSKVYCACSTILLTATSQKAFNYFTIATNAQQ